MVAFFWDARGYLLSVVGRILNRFESYFRREFLNKMKFTFEDSTYDGNDAPLFLDKIIDRTLEVPVPLWGKEDINRYYKADKKFKDPIDKIDKLKGLKGKDYEKISESIINQIKSLSSLGEKAAAQLYFSDYVMNCCDSSLNKKLSERFYDEGALKSIIHLSSTGSLPLKDIAEVCENFGNFSSKYDDVTNGLFYYLTALEIDDSLANIQESGEIENKIAELYLKKKDFVVSQKKAIEHCHKAADFYYLANDTLNAVIAELEAASITINVTYNIEADVRDISAEYAYTGMTSTPKFDSLEHSVLVDKKMFTQYDILKTVNKALDNFNENKSSVALRYYCFSVLGKYFLQKGEFEIAERYFQWAIITRNTTTNYPN